MWDSSSCQCRCLQSPATAHCGPGLQYSEAACSCQPQGPREEAAEAVQREDRASLQASYLPSHWMELALITGLATTSVVLAIVCAALVRRIHRLQARVESEECDIYQPGAGHADNGDRQTTSTSSHLAVKNTGPAAEQLQMLKPHNDRHHITDQLPQNLEQFHLPLSPDLSYSANTR